jgi:hypothetical protein
MLCGTGPANIRQVARIWPGRAAAPDDTMSSLVKTPDTWHLHRVAGQVHVSTDRRVSSPAGDGNYLAGPGQLADVPAARRGQPALQRPSG